MSPFGLKFSQMILHTETSKLMYNWSFLFEVLHKPTLLPSTFNIYFERFVTWYPIIKWWLMKKTPPLKENIWCPMSENTPFQLFLWTWVRSQSCGEWPPPPLRSTVITYPCTRMINYDTVDFGEHCSEEVMFPLMLSVDLWFLIHTFFDFTTYLSFLTQTAFCLRYALNKEHYSLSMYKND